MWATSSTGAVTLYPVDNTTGVFDPSSAAGTVWRLRSYADPAGSA
ncbi:MAG TPA: hypothetical protein VFX16_31885 [Pseudonocardiaceae bacterium]|nr:hypothetical protein [Pseudonocardiaceae bacterium]